MGRTGGTARAQVGDTIGTQSAHRGAKVGHTGGHSQGAGRLHNLGRNRRTGEPSWGALGAQPRHEGGYGRVLEGPRGPPRPGPRAGPRDRAASPPAPPGRRLGRARPAAEPLSGPPRGGPPRKPARGGPDGAAAQPGHRCVATAAAANLAPARGDAPLPIPIAHVFGPCHCDCCWCAYCSRDMSWPYCCSPEIDQQPSGAGIRPYPQHRHL